MLKKTIFYIILSISLVSIWNVEATAVATKEDVIFQTASGSAVINAEIAVTAKQQEKGLMHRMHMEENDGMLFVLNHPRDLSMWMKDTPLSLDMFFIDENGTIVFIAENTKPNSLDHISSGQDVKAVLETKAGVAKKKNISVGTKVTSRYFKP